MKRSERVCRRAAMLRDALGGGVIGNTTGSGPVIEGSSPSPRARVEYSSALLAPSSSGLGRRPLKPVTPVRIRSGLPLPVTATHESGLQGKALPGFLLSKGVWWCAKKTGGPSLKFTDHLQIIRTATQEVQDGRKP